MSYIMDKVILIVLCAFPLAEECSTKSLVVLSLLGVILASVNFYLEKRNVALVTGLFYLVVLIFSPQAILMAPVVLYDLFAKKLYVLEAILGVFLIAVVGDYSIKSVLMLLVLIALSHLMYFRSYKNQQMEVLLRKSRDDSHEKNWYLTEKNQHLIESQDQEVYVATLKERNRIAREIHDNVGHMITRSILQMGALMTLHKEEPLHGQLESVKNNLDVAMNNIRESVHDLHDESIDLKASIADLLKELQGDFSCKFDYDISQTVERKYKYAIIGIVREAVSNIIKHSKGDAVEVILREHPGMYQLVVHDYETETSSSPQVDEASHKKERKNAMVSIGTGEGIGLQNMQDRVAALGGNISIDTEKGYRIFVTFPKEERKGAK